MRVQRREHPVLAGMRRTKERDQPGSDRGEGAFHIRGLYIDIVTQRGNLSDDIYVLEVRRIPYVIKCILLF